MYLIQFMRLMFSSKEMNPTRADTRKRIQHGIQLSCPMTAGSVLPTEIHSVRHLSSTERTFSKYLRGILASDSLAIKISHQKSHRYDHGVSVGLSESLETFHISDFFNSFFYVRSKC